MPSQRRSSSAKRGASSNSAFSGSSSPSKSGDTSLEHTTPGPLHEQGKKKKEEGGEKHEQIHYEFGGPIGALFVMLSLPAVIYMLYFLCNDKYCMRNPMTFEWKDWWNSTFDNAAFFSWKALMVFCVWMFSHLIMQLLLPGEMGEGVCIPELGNKRLKYCLSGHLQFWITLAVVLAGSPAWSLIQTSTAATPLDGTYVLRSLHRLPLEWLYGHYSEMIGASCVFSMALSIYLFAGSYMAPPKNSPATSTAEVASASASASATDGSGSGSGSGGGNRQKVGRVLAKGGDTPSSVYNFFIGRELNPRPQIFQGWIDLKVFCELRPGLIGWMILNIAMAFTQYSKHAAASGAAPGEGFVSMSMLCVVFSQGFYVWDALYAEKAILTTMDVTTDGFGFMLAFGDLAWVPFIYSLQARYLVDHDPQLSLMHILLCMAIQATGYYIFRSSNSQKDAFRKDPSSPEVAHLTFLKTRKGTSLLTSGWWGMARKINYTGDWLITLSWCLLCGGSSPIPYFQAIYFAILLVHRAIRDDAMCSEKYGDDWTEYKKRVPYMFIPGVL